MDKEIPQSCTQIHLKLPHPPTGTLPLSQSQLKTLTQNPQSLTMSHNPLISLSLRKLSRPLYLATVCRYRNRETNEEVEVVEEYQEISKVYQCVKMADFYVGGAGVVGGVKHDLSRIAGELGEIKDQLKRKILDQDFPIFPFHFLTSPTQFLKPFNLDLPTTDLLVNKLKKDNNEFRSKHISFGAEMPSGPDSIPEYVRGLAIFQKVQEYVLKRPCWLRNVLEYQLRIDGFRGMYSISDLKSILKYLCYTFRDGPWKHVFCRFGYNPTQVKEATIFQILMVKIKRKEVEDYDDREEILDQQNDVYDPTLREIPTKYLRIYQLCDIEDKRMEGLIKQAAMIAEECNKETGWLGKNEYSEMLRLAKSIRDERSRQSG